MLPVRQEACTSTSGQKKLSHAAMTNFSIIDERPETKLNALRHNLQFPVQAYVKVNGFLGIVGYDNAQKKLLVTSKGDMYGLYAKIFTNTLAAELKERMLLLEDFVRLIIARLSLSVLSRRRTHILSNTGSRRSYCWRLLKTS